VASAVLDHCLNLPEGIVTPAVDAAIALHRASMDRSVGDPADQRQSECKPIPLIIEKSLIMRIGT
jgi:hypothetical protein